MTSLKILIKREENMAFIDSMRNCLVPQMSTYCNLTMNHHPQMSIYNLKARVNCHVKTEKHATTTKLIDKSTFVRHLVLYLTENSGKRFHMVRL